MKKDTEIKSMRVAALYIRVSTDKQEELSPDAQKRLLLDYAKSHGLIVPPEFIFMENGISGRKADKRPEFQKMIALAKSEEHPIDVIVVWKFSRFARNQEESIMYKSLLSRKNHVDVISISEPLIDGPFGTLMERIIEWMDEYYSINLSQEVIRGMTEKAYRGGYQSQPPLGYKSVPGSHPVIDSETAPIVTHIFESYLDGMDFSSIARAVNEKGYRTSRGNPFELRTIRYILENPFYIGKVRWNMICHSTHEKNPDDEIIIVDGAHDPIISAENFNAVAERIRKEFRPARRKGAGVTKHWLCGLLKCSVCGATLTYYKPENKIHGGFQCYRYAKGAHPGSCHITDYIVLDAILKKFEYILSTNEIEFEQKSISSLNKNTSTWEQELKIIEQKEKRIKSAYMSGVDSLEEYSENKELLRLERDKVMQFLRIVPTAAPEEKKREMLNSCKSVYDIIRSDADAQTKSAALRSICNEITYDRKSDKVTLCFYTVF
ncbi:MAG: recombinase family protein [Lachnospiraceae bacterium]